MVSGGWIALAISVFAFSFGAGWWVSLGALAMAWAAWRFKTVAVSIVSAAIAVAVGLYWLAIIPVTTGSELVLALLVVESGTVALVSWRRATQQQRSPVVG